MIIILNTQVRGSTLVELEAAATAACVAFFGTQPYTMLNSQGYANMGVTDENGVPLEYTYDVQAAPVL
ncbi:hypothetical protein [Catellatospora sichuanensis]|uniref:hypothetical protein n=1 Tax=Catellatospora sichuanensis TaxID=1969805 RepID=UPI0011838782|nr:hypothetical protein [Catellatospora sichuanensis]